MQPFMFHCTSSSKPCVQRLSDGKPVADSEGVIWAIAGMLCVALTPTLQLAAVCSAYVYSIFNLFAGFAITQPNMPGWW